VGTSIGLAILGAIGTRAATSAWTSQAAHLPGAARQAAIGQARNVASARISSVTTALGPSHRAAAEQAFTHGYHVAVLTAGLCLIVAAITAATGLPGNRRRELDPAGNKPAMVHGQTCVPSPRRPPGRLAAGLSAGCLSFGLS
jgi:hypothetical protein